MRRSACSVRNGLAADLGIARVAAGPATAAVLPSLMKSSGSGRKGAFRRFGALAVAVAIVLVGPRAQSSSREGGFVATVERPLFSPTRRPPPPPSLPQVADVPPAPPRPPPPLPPAPPPQVELSGIILGGGINVAILRRPQDAAPVHVALGSAIDGWTVAEIRPRAVLLQQGDRRVSVDLPVPPSSGPPQRPISLNPD